MMPSIAAKIKKKQIPRWVLIIAGIITILCCGSFLISSVIDTLNPTPEPTIDLISINQTALIAAWLPYTQTAAAIPTATNTLTETPTETPIPTNTIPTFTSLPTSTPLPTNTATFVPYVPPTQPPYPSDITAVCNDGSYSYSKTRSGTCSGHGGVSFWVNRPAK